MSLEHYKKNIQLFYGSSILTGLIGVFAPIIVIFQTQVIGIPLGQVLMIEGFFALTVMLFEIPSGIFADRFSRRTTLLFGSLTAALGIFIFGISQNIWHVLISQVIMGIGLAARSGADQAIIYDSLKSLKQTHKYPKLLADFKAIEYGSAILATACGGLLAAYFGLRTPILVSSAMFFLVTVTWFFLSEPPRAKLQERSTFLDYGKKGFALIGQTPFLLWLVIFTALITAGLKINFHTLNPLWEANAVPLTWFGFTLAAYNGMAMTTSLVLPKVLRSMGAMKALLCIWLIVSIGFMVLAIMKLGVWGAVAFPIIFQIARSFMMIVPNDLLQKNTESDTRATVISMKSFMNTMAQTICLFIFGVIADSQGFYSGFAMMAVLLTICGGLALWGMKRARN